MTALAVSEILDRAAAAGLRLIPDGDLIRVRTKQQPPADLLAAIREHKTELLAVLKPKLPALPREWAAGVARLQNMPCPIKVSPERWRIFRADCALFLESWQATRAVQLGWSTLDLFGAHCRAPTHRVQASGLLWLLDSRLIAAMTTEAATIRCASGSVQTYRRSGPHIGQVPAWELPL